MRKALQKATILAALAAFSLGGTASALAQEKKEEKNGQCVINMYPGYSDGWYVSGDADIQVNANPWRFRATPYLSTDGEGILKDWNQNNYTDESKLGLKNAYVEFDKQDFAIGGGIKNLSDAENLVGLLRDPNDSNAWIGKSYPGFEPLGAPAVWGRYKLGAVDLTGTVSMPVWSKIDPSDLSPDGGPETTNPHGIQGANFQLKAEGKVNDFRIKGIVEYFNSPWMIDANNDGRDTLEPDTYKVLSIGGAVEKDIDSWTLGVAGAYRMQGEHVDDTIAVVPSVAKRFDIDGQELMIRGSANLEAKLNSGDSKIQDQFDPRRYLANSAILEASYDITDDIFTEAYGVYNPDKKASIVGAMIGKQIDKNWAVGVGGAHTSGLGDRAAEWSVGLGIQYKFDF